MTVSTQCQTTVSPKQNDTFTVMTCTILKAMQYRFMTDITLIFLHLHFVFIFQLICIFYILLRPIVMWPIKHGKLGTPSQLLVMPTWFVFDRASSM